MGGKVLLYWASVEPALFFTDQMFTKKKILSLKSNFIYIFNYIYIIFLRNSMVRNEGKKVENFPDFSYLVFSVFSQKYERLYKNFVFCIRFV